MQELAENPRTFRPTSGVASGPGAGKPMTAIAATRKRVEQFLDDAHRASWKPACSLSKRRRTRPAWRSRKHPEYRQVERGGRPAERGGSVHPRRPRRLWPPPRQYPRRPRTRGDARSPALARRFSEGRRGAWRRPGGKAYLRGQLTRALARLRFAPAAAPDIGAEPSRPGPRRRRHAGAAGVLAAAARPRLGRAPRGKREAGRDRSRDAGLARSLGEPQGALGPAGGSCGEGGRPRHLYR